MADDKSKNFTGNFNDAVTFIAGALSVSKEEVIEGIRRYSGNMVPSPDRCTTAELRENDASSSGNSVELRIEGRQPSEVLTSRGRVMVNRETKEMIDKTLVVVRKLSKKITADLHPGRNVTGHKLGS